MERTTADRIREILGDPPVQEPPPPVDEGDEYEEDEYEEDEYDEPPPPLPPKFKFTVEVVVKGEEGDQESDVRDYLENILNDDHEDTIMSYTIKDSSPA